MTQQKTTPIRHNPDRLRKLLREMIDIYSPSGKEADIVDFLFRYLKRAGLPVERQEVEEDRDNLLVLPRNCEPRLLLTGHIDTVAATDYDHFEYEEDGDEVYGLGSADMKGGCAAMIEAMLCAYAAGQPDPPVALALVVGEEESGDGTLELLRDYRFPWAIVGEPTDLQPCLNHYSYLEINLETRGQRKHAAMAPLATNAIRSMLHVLNQLLRHLDDQRPDIVYNIRDMGSSASGFATPEFCESWLDLHAPPHLSTAEIALEMEDVLAELKSRHPKLNADLTFSTIHAGYALPDKGEIPDLLKASFAARDLPWKPGAFPSHSDANLLWASGVKSMILGPGSLEKAHTSDESSSLFQIDQACAIYLDVINALTKSQ